MANIKRKLENLKPGREYLLTVRAKNTDVNVTSDFAETIRFTVPTDGSIPGVLANFKLYAGLESVMFVFDFSGDKDVTQHEYELYDVSQVQEMDGVYQLIENAIPISTGSNGANVFTVTIDNLQIATPNSIDTQGLKKFWGRVRAVDNSGNVGPWTILVQTDDRTPLIDNQYVGSLTASKITAGTIGAHEIILTQSGTPSFYDAPANLAILRSSNYEANKDGWLIRGDGYVEFAEANLRGSINASDFNLLDNAATPNIVASLGPAGYSFPILGSGVSDLEWVAPDYTFGFSDVSTDHSLVFYHLDDENDGSTPRFSDSAIMWSQGDDVRQIISIIGPSAESASPYYEPITPFNPIGATPGYEISPPTLNLTSTTKWFLNDTKRVNWNTSALNSGYSKLLDLATGNDIYSFADISVQTISDGLLDGNYIASWIDMQARVGIGDDSSVSGIEYSETGIIGYSYQINSGSYNTLDGQEIDFGFYGDSFLTGAFLKLKNDGTTILGNQYSQSAERIWPNRQISFGPGSSTKPWEITSGGNAGQVATVGIHENNTDSNPTIAIRHNNLGYDVEDGLDITIGRTNGVAYLIQRREASMAFRTFNTDRLVIDADGNLKPTSDNSYTLGASGARWQAVYAATGTIQTSDERTKTNIDDCDLGLEFIENLRPVKYNYIIGNNKVEKNPDDPENPIITPVPGSRVHYGLLAQEVKQTLDSLNIKDFGGWILTDINNPDSEQGLRYDQFIAPLINSIKELNQKIENIENHLGI